MKHPFRISIALAETLLDPWVGADEWYMAMASILAERAPA